MAKDRIFIVTIIFSTIIFGSVFYITQRGTYQKQSLQPSDEVAVSEGLNFVDIQMSYVSQLPDDTYEQPWSSACEEASITMIEQFYRRGNKPISKEAGKQIMNSLFEWENKNFGYNEDTNASSTAQVINEFTSLTAQVKENPTLEEIKNEIKNNRPVLSFHAGDELKNPYLHFREDGSNFHTVVLKGYDEKKKEFIAHDPGTYKYSGENYRYSYEVIMDSLHDYDLETKNTKGGKPVVIFTDFKMQ